LLRPVYQSLQGLNTIALFPSDHSQIDHKRE
jgi:hypothetical protein